MRLAHEGRRIAGQHEALAALEAATRRAFERGDDREVGEAARGFEAALAAHFDLEEQVHFPALHGHEPALGPKLEQLVREHAEFREALAALRRSAESGDRPAVAAAFDQVVARLRDHEVVEESLFPA
jgi:iron-sulfur cluster repair protein YtfE (RIC family)